MDLTVAHPIPGDSGRAAFPLGGVGTGNVSLGARGELRDWEVENRPDKGRRNPFTFFAISAAPRGGPRVTRVIESRLNGPHDQDEGYAFSQLAGLPRLRSSQLRGEYPFVEIEFQDDVLPVEVRLTAFTPLVPLDSRDSGIPAAVLRYSVTNPGPVAASVTVVGTMSHIGGLPEGERWEWKRRIAQTLAWREGSGIRGLDFGLDLDEGHHDYGTLSLLTTDESVTTTPTWPLGSWSDAAQLFWDDLTSDGLLEVRDSAWNPPAQDRPQQLTEEQLEMFAPKLRTGSLGIVHDIEPGETRDFEFVLSWSFPNRSFGWEWNQFDMLAKFGDTRDVPLTRNFYATQWPDAWSAGSYLLAELPRLEGATRLFHDALFASDVDPAVLDAVSANIVAARSTTCFRIEDGSFFAWEGSMDHEGSCAGTCTHVWQYAQTVAWLFPDLERSARRNEYLVETEPDGMMPFRTNKVFGGPAWTFPAVDGQLGTFLRLHREWRFSGDDAFLRELWPAAKSTLDYAIANWDADGDGVLDALMHNTYDIEFLGAEPLSNVMFLAALRAAVRMAIHLEDPEASERYGRLADRAAPAIDALLYNGEFYQQRTADVNLRKYQYGDGVLSDQLLGQFHAHLNGLGFVLPEEHVKSAIRAVFAHNFRPDLSRHESIQRVYAVNDEGGLLLASWPAGGRPELPFVYSDEVWTGIEYQVATELIYCGYVDEALTIVRALRSRYDGRHRNPWNEIECGNHYARAMSSWGLLLALSGVQYDGIEKSLSFAPVGDGRYFFSTGTGWGLATIEGERLGLEVLGGELRLDAVALHGRALAVDGVVLAAGESAEL